jgi:hypothetical protein
MGAAAIAPAALGELHPASAAPRALAAADVALEGLGRAVPVKINIAAAAPIRKMTGGIGASIHVIGTELPSKKPGRGDSWSGSEWGGNPDPSDESHWQELAHHAEWLGMDWCRVELEQRVYEPGKRKFDWHNSEMQVLYMVLDWAEGNGVDVFLTQMWANVAWNAIAGNADDPVKRLRSGPDSIPEFAFGLGELLDHLTSVKGYTCIKWVVICNEPEQDGFSWWQDANMKAMPITPGIKAVREEFDRRGIRIPLSGPDWPYLPAFEPAKVQCEPYVGAFDFHSYDAVFDSMGGENPLAKVEKNLADWAKWAHDKNKSLFLSEMGTMAFGWGSDDAAPACYQSGLKNASLVVRGINAGVDGFNRWSFTNRGDLDGQWQLVRTWDIEANRLLDTFTPQPNAYYQFAMLTRYFPKHSGVLATKVEAPFQAPDRKLVAAALRTPRGGTTILVVNESHHAADVTIVLEGLAAPLKLQRYSLTKQAQDKVNVEINPERTIEVTKEFKDRIAPESIAVYSTYTLRAEDPGLISE